MKKFTYVLPLLIGVLGAVPAQAEPDSAIHEFKLGILHHDTDGLWSGFRRESGFDLNLEAVFVPSTRLLAGVVRPALGISVNSEGDTSKVYLDARWETEVSEPLSFSTGVGVALHNGERDLVSNQSKALGSSLLIHVPIELTYRVDEGNSLSIYFDHVSNGYLSSPNEGMDTLGIRYGYRY